jgi:hypothetical protein
MHCTLYTLHQNAIMKGRRKTAQKQ